MRFSTIAVAALLFHSSAESFGSLLSHLAGNFGRRAASTSTAFPATRTSSFTTTLSAFRSGSSYRRSLNSNSLFVSALAASSQRTPQTCPGARGMTTTARSLSARGGMASSTALNSAVAECELTEKPAPVEVFRSDYRPLPYFVTKINMDFIIQDGKTTVVSELSFEPNPNASDSADDMVLDGDESSVKLMKLEVDGRDLVEGEVCVQLLSNRNCIYLVRHSLFLTPAIILIFIVHRNIKSSQESLSSSHPCLPSHQPSSKPL
jgi:hypothetical protein